MTKKKALVLLSSLISALAVAWLAPVAAHADRTDQIVTSYGRGTMLQQPNSAAGSLRIVNYVNDSACDAHEVYFKWKVYANGGTLLHDGGMDTNNQGCNTVNTVAHQLLIGDLQGNRSGYMAVTLCQHAGIRESNCQSSSWPWSL